MWIILFRTAATRNYSGTAATGKAFAMNATAGRATRKGGTPAGRNRNRIPRWEYLLYLSGMLKNIKKLDIYYAPTRY
jgi:hypothetical protein